MTLEGSRIDSSERGIKKRLTGIDEFKITRGANVN